MGKMRINSVSYELLLTEPLGILTYIKPFKSPSVVFVPAASEGLVQEQLSKLTAMMKEVASHIASQSAGVVKAASIKSCLGF